MATIYVFVCFLQRLMSHQLKMRHLKKICVTNAGQIREQDIPLPSIAFTNLFRCLKFDLFFFTNVDVVTIIDETSEESS